MAAINRIMLSEAVIQNRFSAEFFDPRYAFNPTKDVEWVSIGSVLKKCEYGLSISMNSSEKGYPIFRMNELRDCFALRPSKYANVSSEIFNAYALQENDVLFNRTNSFDFVGRTGIVKDQTDCTFASYLIRLVPDTAKLLPQFLTIYLNTPFGIGQVKRRAMRSINQANVSGSEVRRVLIPLFEISIQEEIATLVDTAYCKQRESLEFDALAESLLATRLGLNESTFSNPVSYTAKFSNVEAARRFDADHYFPRFRAFNAALPPGISLSPLADVISFCRRGKQPVYSDTGIRVINSKHVQHNRVVLKGTRSALPNSDSALNIRSGDVLLNGTGRGTIGRAAPYISHTPAIADNHVTILRSTIDPAFLSLYLNSVAGQMQVEMHQRGTSGQTELYPADIHKFQIWNAPAEFQLEIRTLHEKAANASSESKVLLDKAKNRVVELVKSAMT